MELIGENRLNIKNFKHGLTVRELKEIIENWPEFDDDGEPTEVWIECKAFESNPVYRVSSLNVRLDGDGGGCFDLLFSSDV